MTRHLVISATQFEIQPVIDRLGMISSFNGSPEASFHRGPGNVDVLISGVGQMQTGYWIGRILAGTEYSSVLNFGIAGSFRDTFAKCSVVQIVQEVLADLGAEERDRLIDLFEMQLLKPDTPPFRDGVLIPPTLELECLATLPKVKSITVNTVLGRDSSIATAVARYDPDVVNMEGAAVFYACAISKIPCVSVRSISDRVGPRDKSTWDIHGAIKSLCGRANEILDALLEQPR